MSEKPTVEDLVKRIKDYVGEHRESEFGGYANITQGDVNELYDIVWDIIHLKCDPDPDGDYPFSFALCDRRKFQMQSFPYIPRMSYDEDPTTDPLKRGGHLDVLTAAIRSLMNDFTSELSIIQHLQWKNEEVKKKMEKESGN